MRPLLLAALALIPACGDVLYDQSQRALILEPVDRVTFDLDIGSVDVFAFNRTAISLLYYMSGAESQIVDVGWELRDDEVHGFIDCKTIVDQHSCLADFTVEVPYGTAVVSHTTQGNLTLTGVDAPVEATVAGTVTATGLAAPTLDVEVSGDCLDADGGCVNLAYISPPQSVRVTVEAGDLNLTLPAGSYRCDLTTAEGDIDRGDVACDDAATSSLEISVGTGNITLQVAS